jgi:SAM-dependent methyltransferase
MIEIEAIYEHRFNESERIRKNEVWKILCRYFFQRYIRKDDAVLDLGAGFCEFINNIDCGKRYAVDLNHETMRFASPGVIVYRLSGTDLSPIVSGTLDLVFCSNFFEHLPDKHAMSQSLHEIHRVLKSGGRIMILQPNIRYLYKEYWDFFDHHIPFSHISMVEALVSQGFQPTVVIPRFVPFTMKSTLPKSRLFVRAYLMFPVVWRIMGRQMFILADKRDLTE